MKKILLGLILAFLLMAGAVPGTVIDGYNCAFKTPREVEEILENRVSSYSLEIRSREEDPEIITAKEAGLHCVSAGSVKSTFDSQDAKLWFLQLGKNHVYGDRNPVRADEKMLKARVSALECVRTENQIQPSDAYIRDTGSDSLLNNILNCGLVNDREHFLGKVLCCRKNSCAEPRCGDYCLCNFHFFLLDFAIEFNNF